MEVFSKIILRLKNNYFVKNGFWVSVAFSSDQFFSIAFQLFLIKFFSKEIYGKYQFSIAVSGVIMALSLMGVRVAVVNHSARGNDWCLKEALKFQWRISVALLLIHVCAAFYYYSTKQDPFLFSLLLVLGLTSPLINISNTYSSFLQGKKEFKKLSKISLLLNFGANLGALLSIFIWRNPIFSVAISQSYRVIMNCYLTYKTYHQISFTKPNEIELRKFRNESLHFSFLSSLGSALLYVDKIIVEYFLGMTYVADLSLATVVTSKVKSLLKNINTLQIPKLASQKMKLLKDEFAKYVVSLILVDLVVTFFAYLLSPFLIRTFFPQYLDTLHLAQLAAFELVFFSLSGYLGSILKSKSQIKSLYQLTFFQYTLKLILYICLTKWYGIEGSIGSRIIANLISTGLISVYVWNFVFKKNHVLNETVKD